MSTRLQRPLWQDAYDAQMGLWRWYRTPGADQWLGGLFKDSIDGDAVPFDFKQRMMKQYDAETGRLVECDPFYVTEEMVEIVDHARHGFEPEPLQEWDLLTPRGFLYYARPIAIGDKRGRSLPIRAFAWSQEYTTVDDGEEGRRKVAEYLEALPERAIEGRFLSTELEKLAADGILESSGIQIGLYCDTAEYIEISAHAHNENSDKGYEKSKANMLRMTAGTPLVPTHIAPWPYGMTYEGNETDVYGEPTSAKEWWQLAQTTLRLMQQRRPVQSYGRPQRASRREWERLGGRPDTEIVIVRLRREASPQSEDREENGEGRKLTHRHLRAGHWRNQWYGSIQQHRQIYINPTVVGDESLPLQMRPRRVFQWQR